MLLEFGLLITLKMDLKMTKNFTFLGQTASNVVIKIDVFLQILSMIEEAAGTKMYESKKQSAFRTMEKKESKLTELEKVKFSSHPIIDQTYHNASD